MRDWQTECSVIVDSPNKRIRIMKGRPSAWNEHLFEKLNQLEKASGATKTIVHAKREEISFFEGYGFKREGQIDGFFNGQNAYILSRFQTVERATSKSPEKAKEILSIALADNKEVHKAPLPEGMVLRQAEAQDTSELAQVFRVVFPSYPTPMHDPDYIAKVLSDHTTMMVLVHNGKIVSVSSAEVTPGQNCAEMTDCATLPDYRGNSLLQFLFFALEECLEKQGIYYLFSLTRALSPAMNITTARHGYQYRGRLINNCNIYSGFEDMNIWVKPLRPTKD